MSGRTRVAWPRLAGRHKRALALLLSAAFHVFVLGWFALKQAAEAPLAETPPLNVELVRRPPTPPSPANAAPSASTGLRTVESPHRADAVAAPPASTQAGVDPRWSVDLNGPVFADGQWPRPGSALRSRCDPAKDPGRLSPACRREDEIARLVTAANDPQYGKGDFARDARRKDAIRAYRNGNGETPTMPCMVFNLC